MSQDPGALLAGDHAAPRLGDLLVRQRSALERFVERHGSGLLRYESVNDLVQGVHLHALEVEERFEYRGEREFDAWMNELARRHIADRFAYWLAQKRFAGKLLRITSSDATKGGGSRFAAVHPAGRGTSPGSYAEGRERFLLALKAVALLPPRDQTILGAMAEGCTIGDLAGRLETTYDAAERARLRALARFQKLLLGLASSRF